MVVTSLPASDQSGVSHAISLHHALRVSERGPRRFGISGTPGDCAVMGICHLMTDGAPQLLLSGVNRGLNLGMETVFSGTVGGAMTGMMLGVPSIALSQAYKDRNNVLWDASRTLGAKVVRDLLVIGWSKDACLNVNFPACSAAEAGPVTLARQGVGMVAGMHVDTRTDPRGMTYHWLNFRRGDRQQGPESDYDAMMPTIVDTFAPYYDGMLNDIAIIYANNFTVGELREIEAFYRQPVGQKLLEKTPAITQLSNQVGLDASRKAAEDLRARLTQVLREKGHKL